MIPSDFDFNNININIESADNFGGVPLSDSISDTISFESISSGTSNSDEDEEMPSDNEIQLEATFRLNELQDDFENENKDITLLEYFGYRGNFSNLGISMLSFFF